MIIELPNELLKILGLLPHKPYSHVSKKGPNLDLHGLMLCGKGTSKSLIFKMALTTRLLQVLVKTVKILLVELKFSFLIFYPKHLPSNGIRAMHIS